MAGRGERVDASSHYREDLDRAVAFAGVNHAFFARAKADELVNLAKRCLGPAGRSPRSTSAALSGLRNVQVALLAFALSVLSWLGVAFSFTLALRGAGLDVGLDAGILVTVATTFSLLLPALPASIGLFEAAALVALDPYGVDDAQALSGAVVIHVLSFVPFLILGPLAARGHAVAVRRAEARAAGR